MYSEAEAAQHPDQTYWFNPTKQPVKLELRMGPKAWVKDRATGRRVIKDNGLRKYVWPPGTGLWLPKELDEAIQVIDESQDPPVIQSGYAPQLVKNGGGARIHEALDVDGQKLKHAAEQAAKSLAEQAAANQGLLIAAAGMGASLPLQQQAAPAPIDPEVEKARAKTAEAEAKKAEAEAKKAEAEAKKAEAEAVKAKADADAAREHNAAANK